MFRNLAEAHRADIIRNGKPMSIKLPGNLSLLSMLKAQPQFARPFIPAEIDTILPESPAEKMGLLKGDIITSINNKPVDSWNEWTNQIGVLSDMLSVAQTHKDSLRLRTVTITYKRPSLASRTSSLDSCTVELTPELQLGVGQTSIHTYYKPTVISYGFLESFPAGICYGFEVLGGYVGDLKYLFTSDGAKSLGGFGAIGSLFPPVWDWHLFWLMTAFLSIILAFMNILPIPALDGGHVLFLIYEMITGRKPSDNFLIKAEYVGFGLLILLMVVANLNDILRFFGIM